MKVVIKALIESVSVGLLVMFGLFQIVSIHDDYLNSKAVDVKLHTLTIKGTKYKWFELSKNDSDTQAIKINDKLYTFNSITSQFMDNSDDYYTQADGCIDDDTNIPDDSDDYELFFENSEVVNSPSIHKKALEDGRIYFKLTKRRL